MDDPPKGAVMGDCVLSADFWPKENGVADEFC